jgi:PAS domain S-box-containing protein
MWLTGLDRVRRFVNRAYVEFLGVGDDEALAFDWRTILHPDDHDRIVAESIAGEASLKPFSLEARYRGPDGTWRWLRSISQPSFDAAEVHNGFVGVAFDLTEARDGESLLRETEQRLRMATEGAGTGIWEWDLIDRRATWSEETRRIIGVASDDVISIDEYSLLIHGDDLTSVLSQTNHALAANREFAIEYRVVRPDGNVRWVISRGVGLRDGNGRMVRTFGTINDITDRKLAEEALRDAEERVRIATESAGIGTWDWDLPRGRGSWSKQARAILGVDRGDNISLEQRFAAVYPADRAALIRRIGERMVDGADFDMEYRIVRPDGTVRWVASRGVMLRGAEGRVVRTIGTLRDITTRRDAQEQLEQLNRTLESQIAERTRERDAMWRLSRDLLLVLDPRLRIVAINPMVAELAGYAPDEVIGQSFAQLVHPEDRPALAQPIRRGRRERIVDIDARVVTRDGKVRQFVWNATPEGGLAYVSGRDVTDERARQDELFAAQEALRQAQKLEAIGQLTGGVAHDFNNLLSPIIGGLDILRRRGVGGDREHRLIDGALQSAERAKVLVQRLLAFARRQPLQVRSVALEPLLDELRGLLVSTLGPQIELSIIVAPGLDPVMADANQLEMAILNLAVNARDAMPEGGRLRVSAQCVVAASGTAFIEVAVSDEGIGMDEETLARAAEPFFSSKGLGKGTGLGLSMVEGLTAQLGGSMHITSRPGEGTTVTLCLPVARRASVPAAPIVVSPEASGKGRLLVVDDEPLVRLGTAELLRDEGYEVDEADSAESALTFAPFDRFACVVTDYLMPGLNGVELAHRLRADCPTLPILLLSGYADLEAFSELPYLSKPCFGDDLARAVSQLIATATIGVVKRDAVN